MVRIPVCVDHIQFLSHVRVDEKIEILGRSNLLDKRMRERQIHFSEAVHCCHLQLSWTDTIHCDRHEQ